MRRWKCKVCGYIHDGESPPDICPVCGAPKEMFIEITDEQPAPGKTADVAKPGARKEETPDVKANWMFKQISKHHLHPISVHIPNGVLPVSIIFLILAALFQKSIFSTVAHYNLVFVVLSMPMVLFSGFIDWKLRYKGIMTFPFKIKIGCGIVVTLASLLLTVWLFIDPQVAVASPLQIPFLIVCLVLLAAAGLAGFFGGKLVFND